MNRLYWLAFTLTIIGGINWLFVGLFDLDLVTVLFGPMTPFSRIIYTLVGLSAIYLLVVVIRDKNKRVI